MKANYQGLILASLISTSCIYMNRGFQEEAVFGGQGCVCACMRVCYKALFSSEGRLMLLERRAQDCQLICFSNFFLSFGGNCFTDYRYIRRQQHGELCKGFYKAAKQ